MLGWYVCVLGWYVCVLGWYVCVLGYYVCVERCTCVLGSLVCDKYMKFMNAIFFFFGLALVI